jgi:hypothetical protein
MEFFEARNSFIDGMIADDLRRFLRNSSLESLFTHERISLSFEDSVWQIVIWPIITSWSTFFSVKQK